MGWKHIITLYQIYVPSKECVVDCINGSTYAKKTYVEALTTGMVVPPSDYVNVEN